MKPNLFIIGGPKCGTSALCSYLADHPNICFSAPKEPKYFNTDFSNKHREAISEAKYLACFAYDPAKHRIISEGSVWYLYSHEAVSNILQFNPDARFVVMIRNPIDLAHSLHSQLLYGGDEDIEDFEEAWRLQDARKLGQSLPAGARDVKSLLYGEVAKFGEQMERLFAIVPRKKVLIINHADFSVDPRREYRRVLAFAELPDDQREAFERVNENRRLLRNPLTAFMFLGRRIKLALGIKRSFGIWQNIQPHVAKSGRRESLNKEFKHELREFFLEDIEKLERLLEVDLTSWKSRTSQNGEALNPPRADFLALQRKPEI